MWLAVATRPDISYAVGVLGRSSAAPLTTDMAAAMRVVQYLRTTKEMGIWVSAGSEQGQHALEGWADADWAGDRRDRKSTSGYVFTLCGVPISWASIKQPTTALSTVHAEYIALCEAARDAAWLLQLLDSLGIDHLRPVPIHGDNNGALTLVQHAAFHRRSKHIEVQWHFVREAQEQGWIRVSKVASVDNIADILTKALQRVAHQRHVAGIGMRAGIRETGVTTSSLLASSNPNSIGQLGFGTGDPLGHVRATHTSHVSTGTLMHHLDGAQNGVGTAHERLSAMCLGWGGGRA